MKIYNNSYLNILEQKIAKKELLSSFFCFLFFVPQLWLLCIFGTHLSAISHLSASIDGSIYYNINGADRCKLSDVSKQLFLKYYHQHL